MCIRLFILYKSKNQRISLLNAFSRLEIEVFVIFLFFTKKPYEYDYVHVHY